jgi:hypothetical protein
MEGLVISVNLIIRIYVNKLLGTLGAFLFGVIKCIANKFGSSKEI